MGIDLETIFDINEVVDDNEELTITPKGIFMLALSDVGLINNLNDRRANVAWKLFELSMGRHGYVKGQE